MKFQNQFSDGEKSHSHISIQVCQHLAQYTRRAKVPDVMAKLTMMRGGGGLVMAVHALLTFVEPVGVPLN